MAKEENSGSVINYKYRIFIIAVIAPIPLDAPVIKATPGLSQFMKLF